MKVTVYDDPQEELIYKNDGLKMAFKKKNRNKLVKHKLKQKATK